MSAWFPKSTLSNWRSGVKLSKEYGRRVEDLVAAGKPIRGCAVALVVNKVKGERLLDELMKNKDVLKTLLSVLRFGEGAKEMCCGIGSDTVRIGSNSENSFKGL